MTRMNIKMRHGRPQKFFQEGKTWNFAHAFDAGDDTMRMHVHKTLCPFYTITKMPRVTAAVAKASFSFMVLFAQYKLRSLPLSAVTVSQLILPEMSAFNSHVGQNTYQTVI